MIITLQKASQDVFIPFRRELFDDSVLTQAYLNRLGIFLPADGYCVSVPD
jgi:hypothetical protein